MCKVCSDVLKNHFPGCIYTVQITNPQVGEYVTWGYNSQGEYLGRLKCLYTSPSPSSEKAGLTGKP